MHPNDVSHSGSLESPVFPQAPVLFSNYEIKTQKSQLLQIIPNKA